MHPKGRCGRPASPIQMLQIVPLFSISFQPIQKKLHLSERSVAISWGIFLWFFFCCVCTVAFCNSLSGFWTAYYWVEKINRNMIR